MEIIKKALNAVQKQLKSGYHEQQYNEGSLAQVSVKLIDIKTDNSSRTVEGYYSSFHIIDSDRDKIMKGTFARSIAEHGPSSNRNRRIAHLSQHDIKKPIGQLQELKEDDFGLYFRSKMGTHTDGEDHLRMYKEGIIREHSIGFNYIPDGIKFVEHEGHPEMDFFEISDVKLWEGSAVTFGANSETPNLSEGKSFNSQADIDLHVEKLNERMEAFIKALRDGRYSEKFNNLAELELYQIQKTMNALIAWEPGNTDRATEQQADEVKKGKADINKLFNQIELK